jgi:hypothetical protein
MQEANQQQNQSRFTQNPYANPYINRATECEAIQEQNRDGKTFGLNNKFLVGLAVGGAVAWVLTNENTQKTIIKTGMKLFSKIGGGVEEFKEKIMDAKAEIEAES